jgi:hypothetical protein
MSGVLTFSVSLCCVISAFVVPIAKAIDGGRRG